MNFLFHKIFKEGFYPSFMARNQQKEETSYPPMLARKYESLHWRYFGKPEGPPILDEDDARHALYELRQEIREMRENFG